METPASAKKLPADILAEGRKLSELALARAKEKGISPHAAMFEIADELAEPFRSWALEELQKLVKPEEH